VLLDIKKLFSKFAFSVLFFVGTPLCKRGGLSSVMFDDFIYMFL